MSLRRFAPTVTLAIVTLAGCGGGDPEADADVETSDPPTVTATVTTQVPSVSDGLTLEETCQEIGAQLPKDLNSVPAGDDWVIWVTGIQSILRDASPEAAAQLQDTVDLMADATLRKAQPSLSDLTTGMRKAGRAFRMLTNVCFG